MLKLWICLVPEENEGRPPIKLKFEIPYFTVSGIQVQIILVLLLHFVFIAILFFILLVLFYFILFHFILFYFIFPDCFPFYYKGFLCVVLGLFCFFLIEILTNEYLLIK